MKRRILSIILSVLMVVSLLPTVAFATTPSFVESGSGSKDDPYIIMTLEQLNAFADAVNTDSYSRNENVSPICGKYFKLGADIGSESGDKFNKIIGISSYPFCANFDGDGHTIWLDINVTSTDYVGLFGTIGADGDSASVHSLTVKGSVALSSMTSACSVGGLVGILNSGTCYDCRSECTVTATSAGSINVGGLVGQLGTGCNMYNCSSIGSVSVTEPSGFVNIGGLCGLVSGLLANSYSSAAVTTSSCSTKEINAGGVCANNNGGTVKNCYSSGNVTTDTTGTKRIGGVCGKSSGTVANCYYNSTVLTDVKAIGKNGDNQDVADTDDVKGLDTTTMQAGSGTTGALVNLLNGYKESDKYPEGWWKWGANSGACPTIIPEYAIINKLDRNASGTIEIDKKTAAANETVTLTVTLDAGVQLQTGSPIVTYTDSKEQETVTTTQDQSNKNQYTFKMPARPVTVTAKFEKTSHDLIVKNGNTDAIKGTEESHASADYYWGDSDCNALYILKNGLTVSGTTTAEHIYVDNNVTDLTINGLNMELNGDLPPVTFFDNVALTLVGNNSIKVDGSKGYEAISFYSNGTITGSGNLEALSASGAGLYTFGGTLTFTQTGTVTATGIYGIYGGVGISFNAGVGKILAHGSDEAVHVRYGNLVTLGNGLTMKGSTAADTAEASITGDAVFVEADTYKVKVGDDVAKSVLIKQAEVHHSSGGGSSTPTVTVPVSGDENTVKVSATVSGSTATVKKIKDADLEKVTEGESVSIDLSAAGKNVDTAKIPTETVEKIAEKSAMTVKLPAATVEFDKTATEEIADQAKGSNIELVVDDIKEVSLNAVQKESVGKLDTAIIIDAHLASNGSRLCTADNGGFGGGSAKVILPYEIKNNRKPENYSVFYVNEAGKLEKLNAAYDEELKAFVFEIEHFSVYAVAFEQFVDIDANAYYYDAVKWAAANGITDGIDDTHFDPNGITNRAQMVTFLWKVAGRPEPTISETPFTDLDPNGYYFKAVLWAYEKGITDGTTETTFEPDMNVSRAQVVTFLWRYSGKLYVDYWMQMTDVESGKYYTEAVRWALAEGITDGTSKTTFSPNDNCLRGQIVTFLYRSLVK